MKTQYINKYINEYGQINIFDLFKRVKFLIRDCKFDIKQLTIAENMINELYEIYTGTIYDNINNDLFVLGFDNECEMFLLINKISKLKFNN